jgi:hypothetical protein
MRSAAALILLAIASAAGCESNGQTGSLEYACTDADCARLAKKTLDQLAPSPPPTFVASACHEPDLGPARSDTLATYYCSCTAADGGTAIFSADAQNFAGVGGAPGDGGPGGVCIYRGRGGFCVLGTSDVPMCDPGDPNSCRPACDVLQRRLAEDATHVTKDFSGATVRFARCVSPTTWTNTRFGLCRIVIATNNACYTNDDPGFSLTDTPHDCSLSDEEIVFPGAPASTGALLRDR